jgi:hypothetical protein
MLCFRLEGEALREGIHDLVRVILGKRLDRRLQRNGFVREVEVRVRCEVELLLLKRRSIANGEDLQDENRRLAESQEPLVLKAMCASKEMHALLLFEVANGNRREQDARIDHQLSDIGLGGSGQDGARHSTTMSRRWSHFQECVEINDMVGDLWEWSTAPVGTSHTPDCQGRPLLVGQSCHGST